MPLCINPFQWCKINLGQVSFWKIITTYNLWILICFPRYFKALAKLPVQFSSWQHVKLLGHHLHKDRRWYNAMYRSGCFGNALHELLNNLEAIRHRHVYAMKCCACDGWASCSRMLPFFSCTACLCTFSSGQLRLSEGIGSKFHVYKLLSVSQGMLVTSEFLWSMYFGVLLLVLSKLKLSFPTNSRFHLLWQLLQSILPA